MPVSWSWGINGDKGETEMKSSGKCFLGVCTHEGVFQRLPKLYLPLAAEVLVESHPDGAGSEDRMGSGKAPEVCLALWDQERRWRCGLSSSENPGWKRPRRVWSLASWIELAGGCWWKCGPVAIESPKFWKFQYHQRPPSSVRDPPRTGRQTLCATEGRAKEVSDSSPSEEPRKLWVNPRYGTLCYLNYWSLVPLCSDCVCALDLPWSKKVLNLYFL